MTTPAIYSKRLKALRDILKIEGLDAIVIPRTDEFLGEYLPERSERLAWLTGFTGSAGTAVVLPRAAALFVDGRYTAQAPKQVDTAEYTILEVPQTSISDWLKQSWGLPAKAKIQPVVGFAPSITSQSWVESITTKAEKYGFRLIPVSHPIDLLWQDRPDWPATPPVDYPLQYAGQSCREKLGLIKDTIRSEGCHAALIPASDSVSWLFNIRASDVPHTPFLLGYAFVPAAQNDRPMLFTHDRDWEHSLCKDMLTVVNIYPMEDLESTIYKWVNLNKNGGSPKVLLDFATSPASCHKMLTNHGAEVVNGRDPCQLPKARKNEVEQNGMRAAHLRDGTAVCKALSEIGTRVNNHTETTELDVEEILLKHRFQQSLFQDTSFDTIAGFGSNGAIVHYRATTASNKTLTSSGILLLDSGGQYLDGTTDITRTFAILAGSDKPLPQWQFAYTHVLKAHIALSMATFPKGTDGAQLDGLTRNPLWQAGLDFAHGTGHGVGSYLSVHEGPQGISRRAKTPLEVGMVVSNEPGYYYADAENGFGIRIENLVMVQPLQTSPQTPLQTPEDSSDQNGWMRFETLTCVPYDRHLILKNLLTWAELQWVNAYNQWVWNCQSPHLEGEDLEWLRVATAGL